MKSPTWRDIAWKTRRELIMARQYVSSLGKSLFKRKPFETIELYCMFIGYPRSGHSLVGSLLDAHPNMVIAHELDALLYLKAGFSKHQILNLILDKSRSFTKNGRQWAGYNYQVPDQWQGRYESIRVIGDKKGGRSTLTFGEDPGVLDRLEETLGIDVRYIHVVRNPYDNVATMATRQQFGPTLEDNLDAYAKMCEYNRRIEEQVGQSKIIDFRLESLIEQPKKLLVTLCRFLEVDPSDAYLSDCESVVAKTPSRTRSKVEWSPEAHRRVEGFTEEYRFLNGYTFDD